MPHAHNDPNTGWKRFGNPEARALTRAGPGATVGRCVSPHKMAVSDTRFHAELLDVGVVLEDGGTRYRVVRVEQPPNPRAFG
jgi:hypothetical protein